MCEELQNGSLPLLIQTPNGREDTGTSRDCFILNPSAISKVHMKMFEFLGKKLGTRYLFAFQNKKYFTLYFEIRTDHKSLVPKYFVSVDDH